MAEEKYRVTPTPHRLILDNRQNLTLSGVSDVDRFDETIVIVRTSLGELTVKGDGLHVHRLNLENGELVLEGQIDSLAYTEVVSRSGGLLHRLFR